MARYLDDLSEKEWQQLGTAYVEDAMRFFAEEKVFDRADQQDTVVHLKHLEIPRAGMSFQDIRRTIVDDVIPGSIHQHSKSYLAFPDTGSSVAAQYASILSDALNQNLIAEDKSAPTGTYLETSLIHWMRKLVGYVNQDAPYPATALELGGSFVTGGVLANTIALLGARQACFPETKSKGMASITGTPKIIVAGETMSHYSHFGSSWWLGVGTDNIIEAPCDSEGRIDKMQLVKTLRALEQQGDPVIAVIAVMGDSRTNTLEDLPGLYRITQKYGTWLHADACHGGILMFDQTYTSRGKHVLSYSDSLSFDPHKHLGVPYSNSIVLFKKAEHLAHIGSSTDITIAYGSSDIGQVTPFLGSRTFDALKFYAMLLEFGTDGIVEYIEKRKAAAKAWAAALNTSKYFVPLHDPELFAVSFSVRPIGDDSSLEVTRKNLMLHDALHEDGDLILHKFKIRDYRNRLGYGSDTAVMAFGSFIGSCSYSGEDFQSLLEKLEHEYRILFAE